MLGSLGGGLQQLQRQVDEERLHARAQERTLAEVATKVQVRIFQGFEGLEGFEKARKKSQKILVYTGAHLWALQTKGFLC